MPTLLARYVCLGEGGVGGCSIVVVNNKLNNLSYNTVLDGRKLCIYILRRRSIVNNYLRSFREKKCVLSAKVRCIKDLSRKRIVRRCFGCLNMVSSLGLRGLSRGNFSEFRFRSNAACSRTVKCSEFVSGLTAYFPSRCRNLGRLYSSVGSINSLVSPGILCSGDVTDHKVRYVSVSTRRGVYSRVGGGVLHGIFTKGYNLCTKGESAASFCRCKVVARSCVRKTCHFISNSRRLTSTLAGRVRSGKKIILAGCGMGGVELGGGRIRFMRARGKRHFITSGIVSSLRPAVAFSLLSGGAMFGGTFFSEVGSLGGSCKLFAACLLVGPRAAGCMGRGDCLFGSSSM